MEAALESKQSGIEGKLTQMMNRARSMEAYLDRVLFRQYQKAQLARWQSENASEGETWAPLNETYRKWKRKKFASYPGGGNALMIRTGKLMQAATGQDTEGFYKIVTNRGIKIGINLSQIPYAGYASKHRPTMVFSEETLSAWRQGIKQFISKGQMRGVAG